MKRAIAGAFAYAATVAPDLDLTVQAHYVHARPRASMPADDVDVAHHVHTAIDGLLVASAVRAVLFDSRDMSPNSPEVSEVYLPGRASGDTTIASPSSCTPTSAWRVTT